MTDSKLRALGSSANLSCFVHTDPGTSCGLRCKEAKGRAERGEKPRT